VYRLDRLTKTFDGGVVAVNDASLFLEHKLLTLILAIYIMVTLVDYLSAFLRRRLL
jgi:ABC-type phosphate/phosphonate transport system permease subunit